MQPYVVKNNESPAKGYGFDDPLAEGIPVLSDYLADYCSVAVSSISSLSSLIHLRSAP